MLVPVRDTDRRLLLIYDLSSQPFSIGDILVFQEASLVLRERYKVDLVDFAIVYDNKSPAPSSRVFSDITETNVTYHLASILPVAQVNQHLGSLFVFNSHKQLEEFVVNHIDGYHIWPSGWRLLTKDYLYYDIFNKIIYDYYNENGTIPHLTCRQFLVNWAWDFYQGNVLPDIPVTVQIRNNSKFGINRNLNLDCWLEFFQACLGRYPVKFLIICSLSEMDDRLRGCPNVIMVKDFHTNIEHDLALIHTAFFHMGASSGPGTIAVFGKRPFLIVNTDLDPTLYLDSMSENGYIRLFFSHPLQRFEKGPETPDRLFSGFEEMWKSVNIDLWKAGVEFADSPCDTLLSWLR